MDLVLAIIIGSLFGAALYFTGASAPRNILAMLRLKDLTLMKIIVFAIGFASVLLSVFALLGWFNLDHLSVKATNLGVVLGGLLFGIGFGSIGTCPGTCVAASSGLHAGKAISTILGGLFGAWLFSVTYPLWDQLGVFRTFDLGKTTLFSLSEEYPSVFSAGFSGLLLIGVLFMVIAYLLPTPKQN